MTPRRNSTMDSNARHPCVLNQTMLRRGSSGEGGHLRHTSRAETIADSQDILWTGKLQNIKNRIKSLERSQSIKSRKKSVTSRPSGFN